MKFNILIFNSYYYMKISNLVDCSKKFKMEITNYTIKYPFKNLITIYFFQTKVKYFIINIIKNIFEVLFNSLYLLVNE